MGAHPGSHAADRHYDRGVNHSYLAVTVDSGIARVVLNKPERRNALSLGMLGELLGLWKNLIDDRDVRVVVVSGAGPVFSAGHDLSEMIDREPEFYDELFNTCTDVMLGIQTLPQPVIAQVHGTATAAGCQLVAACDLAVADTGSRFATPGVHIGLFCSTPMVPVTRAIGRKRAMQMLLTGDFIDAGTALEWGLINGVVPPEDLKSRVDVLARRIMEFSPEVVGIGKRAFYAQVDAREDAAYDTTGPIMSSNATHPDAQEGMAAFLDKRRPQWTTTMDESAR